MSLINTLPGMRIDLARRRPLLANRTGGMSGPGMFPLAVRMVYQVYEAVHIPIVGMGGVTSAQDVLELMLAGATAVGVGAANLVEPYACKHIIETLPDAMARFGIDLPEAMTQKEVADRLGISQSYISRLEKRIIAKMRRDIVSQI